MLIPVLVLLAAAALAGSEWIAARGRRPPPATRTRRRMLAAGLLLLLGAMMSANRVMPFDEPAQWIGWHGVQLVLLLWVMILAARDLRATAMDYTRLRREAVREAMERVERLVAERNDPDNQPIPILRVPSEPSDDAEAPGQAKP